MNKTKKIFNINFIPLNFENHLIKIKNFQRDNKHGYICVANVHMLVETRITIGFSNVLKNASHVVPDGMPIVWLLKLFGFKKAERVAGFDLIHALLDSSEKNKNKIFLLGSTDSVLSKISKNIKNEYPEIIISGTYSPPFSENIKNTDLIIEKINNSNADYVFVAFGCPKQENWMYENYKKINSLLIGVGGAFPLLAGTQIRAPKVIRSAGLEWLFRLAIEPRRLWKRYLKTNTLFIFYLIKDSLIYLTKRN